MNRIIFSLLFFTVLSACGTAPQKSQFRLDLDASLATRQLAWPSASSGQTPRYLYLGELVGEPNFFRPDSTTKGIRDVLSAVVDFIFGEAPPVVMDRPQAGAVDEDGRIFVSDIGRSGIFVFDKNLGKVSFWDRAKELVNFMTPVGIAIGPEGHVFIADVDLGYVAHLDPDGKALQPIGKGHLTRPTGLAYDRHTERIFVTDTPTHSIKVFDLEGRLRKSIGTFGEGPTDLNYPTHLVVREGELYVSDTLNARIQVFSTLDGKHLRQIGKRGNFVGDMVRPKGVASDSEQHIYAVESNHDHLLVYNRAGEFLMAIGGVGDGPGRFHLPAGVWTDARDRIYVADMLNSRVAVYQFLGGENENADE